MFAIDFTDLLSVYRRTDFDTENYRPVRHYDDVDKNKNDS